MTVGKTPVAVRRALRGLGEDLGTWRRLRRLTAVEVADRAGVSRDTVLRAEKGVSISLENLLRIARALGVLDQLTDALDPYASDIGRLRADESLPRRVHRPGTQRTP